MLLLLSSDDATVDMLSGIGKTRRQASGSTIVELKHQIYQIAQARIPDQLHFP